MDHFLPLRRKVQRSCGAAFPAPVRQGRKNSIPSFSQSVAHRHSSHCPVHTVVVSLQLSLLQQLLGPVTCPGGNAHRLLPHPAPLHLTPSWPSPHRGREVQGHRGGTNGSGQESRPCKGSSIFASRDSRGWAPGPQDFLNLLMY